MSREKKVIAVLSLIAVLLATMNVYQAVNPPAQPVPEHGIRVTIVTTNLHNMTYSRNSFYQHTGGSLGGEVESHWHNYTVHIYATTFNGRTVYYDDNGFGLEPVNYTCVYSY